MQDLKPLSFFALKQQGTWRDRCILAVKPPEYTPPRFSVQGWGPGSLRMRLLEQYHGLVVVGRLFSGKTHHLKGRNRLVYLQIVSPQDFFECEEYWDLLHRFLGRKRNFGKALWKASPILGLLLWSRTALDAVWQTRGAQGWCQWWISPKTGTILCSLDGDCQLEVVVV